MILTEFLENLSEKGVELWVSGGGLRYRAPKGVMTPDLLQELADRKVELLSFLEQLNQPQRKQEIVAPPLLPRPRESNLPLSYSQEELWLIEQLSFKNFAPTISFAIRLSGNLNIEVFKRSLQEIVQRHEALRTTFKTVNGQPIQVIAPALKMPLPIVDLSELPEIKQKEKVLQLASNENQPPFDLTQGPLIRATLLKINLVEYVLCLSVHHIVFDIGSAKVFIHELARLYTAFSSGKPSPLSDLPIQYADFAVWQKQWLQTRALVDRLDYWKRQLADNLPILTLPTDRPRPPLQSCQVAQQSFQIPLGLSESLRQLSRREGATLFMTLLAAFKTLLYRYSGQENISVGSPTLGRVHPYTKNLIGSFAYPLVLLTNMSGDPTFRELLARVREVALGAYAHQDVPFLKVVEVAQPKRSGQNGQLFQVMFTYPPKVEAIDLPGLVLSPIQDFANATSHYDLVLSMMEETEGLCGLLMYNPDIFDIQTISQMAKNFQTLLKGIVEQPDEHLSRLPILSDLEQHQQLTNWNNTQITDLQAACIHELFENQAQQIPDAVAIVFENEQLTYQELNIRANQLAYHLKALGVEPEVCVGLFTERSLETVVGLLGILKAGGAYVTLDTQYPKKYISSILEEAQLPLILTQSWLLEKLPAHRTQVICLDSDWESIAQQSKENPVSGATDKSLAYVLYASKWGTQIEHRGIYQRLQWLQGEFGLSKVDVTLHKASSVSDTSIWEVFWSLVYGNRLVIVTTGNQDNSAHLQNLIAEQRISFIHFTPATLSAWIEVCKNSAAELTSLRYVFCSGTPLRSQLVDRFFQFISCKLRYFYGYPETGTEVISQVCQPGELRDFVPAGHPTYVSVYIVDQYLQPVPLGGIGEICIAGEGISRGYLHSPKATAERLIENPFSDSYNKKRLFKTGSQGRRLNDGTLELLGSNSRYTWINGFHINLGELEAILLEDPLVDDCVVLVRETETFKQELVAYVVSSKPFSSERLAARLQQILPAFMLPSAYVSVLNLPFTATGQVDEQALSCVEVIDSDLIQRWEERLRSMPEIEQVKVVVQEQAQSTPLLHLSDLIPDWKSSLTSNVKVPINTVNSQVVPQNSELAKTLASSHGEPLIFEPDAPSTLPAALKRATLQGHNRSIVYIQPDGSQRVQSYGNLLQEAERILAGLRQLGLQPQDKVIFQLKCNQQFIAAFWGCMLGGFVPVPLSVAPSYKESNSTVDKLHHTWNLLEKPIILTDQKMVSAVLSLSTLLGLEAFRVATIDELQICQPDTNWYDSQQNDLALLLLTSGSTGIPKAVMHSHRSLLSQSVGTAQMNGFTSEDVSLNWLPLDHVGGIVMFHIRDVYLVCQQIHAPTEVILQEPLRWLDCIEQFQATITWAPNFAYGLINDQAEEIARRHWDLSSMRFILNAGEAIVPRTARRFLELLRPHGLMATAMHPAWGMSETASAVIYSKRFSLDSTKDDDSFVELGTPIPGCSVRIVNDHNQVVKEREIGRLQVRGSMITSGYYQNQKLNQEVFTDDDWFDTGDLGFLHEDRLTLTGRLKDIIIINGINYYSHEIEAVVEEVEGVEVSYTCACAVRLCNSNTDNLAIFFNTSVSDEKLLTELLKKIRDLVIYKVGINPTYLIPVEKEAIPKTAIGKIQRSQVKQRFEDGEFDSIMKRMDILSANANTLPAWFYRQIWRCRQLVSQSFQIQTSHLLIFLDQGGLGAFLCAELSRQGITCISVEPSSNFAQISAKHYCINPENPEHYLRLLVSLSENDFRVNQILHLWTYNEWTTEVSSLEALEQAQNQGTYSLLFLTQALTQLKKDEHTLRLWVVSSYTQIVSPTDKVAYEKTPMLGLIKTIPQETSWLDCCHIDLPANPVEENAAYIIREIHGRQGEREVAYRNKQRWVPRLEKANLSQMQKQPLPFKQGAMYVLSGGLGGIGVELAKYLLEHYQTKLLLIGQTPLATGNTTPHDLEQQDTASDRIKAYQSLVQLKGDVIYESVDICDFQQLQKVVDQAKSRWECELAGVIHLAGLYQEQLLVDSTREDLATIMRPKVLGTWVLHQLLKNKPQSIFISFSSVNGFFGGARAGAYSAASRFLDDFTHYQRYKSGLQSYCFAWSLWDEIGMGRGYQMKELVRAKGYHTIKLDQGLNSFFAGLHYDQTRLLIGLDGNNRHIQRHTETAFRHFQQLCAYFTAQTNQLPTARLQEQVIRDRFQLQSHCDFQQIQELPLTDAGEIDQQRLIATGYVVHQTGVAKRIAPRTEIEHQITRIWQELLNIPQVGIYDNFFELGGDSILGVQAVAKASQLGLRFTVKQLFQAQTIAELVHLVSTTPSVQAEQEMTGGQIPLTPIQKWFFEQNLPDSNHFNMAIFLEVPKDLNTSLVEAVIQQLLHHHDALRMRFEQHESDWQQLNAGWQESRETAVFCHINLESLPEQEHITTMETAAAQLQTSLNLQQRPLIRVVYFDFGLLKKGRMLFIIHHLVVDGISWRILLEDFQTVYLQLNQGKNIALPPKTTSFQYWSERLIKYAQSEELRSELAYWLESLDKRVYPLPMDWSDGVNTFASLQTVWVSLSVEETHALLQEVPKAYHTQINDVLLTALIHAFVQWTGEPTLLIHLEGHGREEIFEDVDLSRTIGWFTSLFPIQLRWKGSPVPGDNLKSVKEQLRKIPNHGIGYGILRYLSKDAEISEKLRVFAKPEVSFNYLGQFDGTLPKSSPFRLSQEPTGPTINLQATRSHLLDIWGSISEGQLQLNWTYSKNIHQRSSIERLAQDFIKALQGLIAHCQSQKTRGYTPSDFPEAKLNQKNLDKFLSKINQANKRKPK
ncbi:hypothetical protein CAL7716_066160 [Calothrix sp. PCC 7716]|nr:hypothetical protein CAL7716_066160 [Calothrix sp. PCC 7716]